MKQILTVGLTLFTAACETIPPEDPRVIEAAMSYTASGYSDTDFQLNTLAGKPHSFTMRFMLKYPWSYHNTFLGDNGAGGLFIGKTETPSNDDTAVPLLRVEYSGSAAYYRHQPAGLQAKAWYTLAVTVDSVNRVRVYVDGKEVNSTDNTPQIVASTDWARGILRFGQQGPSEWPYQFYGLLDNVAVWDHALSAAEVVALAGETLSGNEPGLIAGWNFDIYLGGAKPAARLDAKLVNHGKVLQPWKDGKPRINGEVNWIDWLPYDAHVARYQLPIKGVSQVTGEMQRGSHHHGYAAFCLDLVPADGRDPSQTEIRAMAPGQVVFIRDTSPDETRGMTVPGCTRCQTKDAQGNLVDDKGSCYYETNRVAIRHADGETTTYDHLKQSSVPQAIKDKLVSGYRVQRGELLGIMGRSGGSINPHLHVCQMWNLGLEQKLDDKGMPVEDSNGQPVMDDGRDPGKDTPKLGRGRCGYYPAVQEFWSVTRAFMFESFGIRLANGTFARVDWDVPNTGVVVKFIDLPPDPPLRPKDPSASQVYRLGTFDPP